MSIRGYRQMKKDGKSSLIVNPPMTGVNDFKLNHTSNVTKSPGGMEDLRV